MATIDFGRTARDYAAHRQGFPDQLFDQLAALPVIRRGMRALDVGTGTGTVARSLAIRGLAVDALDPSTELIAEAAKLDSEAGVRVQYHEGVAEHSGFADATFDVVFAGQCWHWFDGKRAAAEIHRILKTTGHMVICHFDWIPLPGNVVEATERLILEHNPDWAGARGMGLYPWWFKDLSIAGFTGLESFSFDTDAQYSHEAWRGRIRASAGIAASLSSDEVAVFDEGLGRLLADRFPDEPLGVPHRTFALIGVKS